MSTSYAMRRRRTAGLLLSVLLAAGLAGCGDDDEPAVDAGASASEGDLATYCEKTAEIESVGEPEIDFETATPEEQTAAAKEFAQEKLVGLAHQIEEVAPAEISEDIDTLVAAVDELAETGDFESAFGGAVEEASNRTHAFDLENCDWNVVDVTAVDYAFEGLESSYRSGVTSFEFANDGEEMHELILLRKKDDTTETFEELLELPEEEAREKVEPVGSSFAEPGEENVYAVADLDAGEYLAICFIPKGLTPEVAEAAESGGAEPDGPPHFTLGMRREFTVK